jgi:hypothetical protein
LILELAGYKLYNNSTITVVSSATGTGYLAFADGTTTTDRYSGLIEYNHTSNYLGLRTASIERLRIDSAGAILYAAGVYPYSHRRTTISVAAAATVTLFDLWGGNQGRGQYLVSVTRTGGSIATRAVAIVGSSSISVSTVNDVLASTAVTIGVSGSSVTATNTGGSTISILATAVPLVIEGN